MALQNRVTPFGTIVAVPERGTFMGNRGGCLHDARRRLSRRRWVSRRWIVCVLAFKGRKRTVMAPGHYTELFFLDEATALAAGHRPCRECRRQAHDRFKEAGLRGQADPRPPAEVSIDAVDQVLHAERLRTDGSKGTYRARLGDLPDGVFVVLDHAPAVACLVAGGRLWRWTPGGYTGRLDGEPKEEVSVLTPRSTVRAIAAGYQPVVHESVARPVAG